VTLEFLERENNSENNYGLRPPDGLSFSGEGTITGSPTYTGLNYSSGIQTTKGWLKLLVSKGQARVLARPEFYVRLGEEAIFRSGGEIPIPTTSDSFGRTQKHIDWKPYGMMVKVRPQSLDNWMVHSDIDVEVSELNRGHAIEGIPSISKRIIKTKMDSEMGETVILSGLVKQSESNRRGGVPLLSDIPLLGLLFSDREESKVQSEIIMSVTLSLSNSKKDKENLKDFKTRYEKDL
jgi:pilus assembly protein CpaC